ncbi:hypothetical protein [Catenulispora sp. GAS73]|uniref:hypothetical protein n=1 Tax=Catenulispora sp. GAS73 TaxID=3156269 RepID=UPI003516ABDE
MAFLRRRTSRVLELPGTSIKDLEAEIHRQAKAADFADVLSAEQTKKVQDAVEAGTLNIFAEESARDSIHSLVQASPLLIALQYAATAGLAVIGFTTPFADMRHDRFSTAGFEIILAALLVRGLNQLRFRVRTMHHPALFATVIGGLTVLRHISLSSDLTSADIRLPAWADGKATEVVNWYHVAHSATGLVQLVSLWLLAVVTPRTLLMMMHRKHGLGASREDEASSLFLLGLVDIAVTFRRERDQPRETTRAGRPLRELKVADIRTRKRTAISRYLCVLAKFARTAWTRSIRNSHQGTRRDAAFLGSGVSAELLRIQKCIAMGDITADDGYRKFAKAAGTFVDGPWSDLMIKGHTRRAAVPAWLWRTVRQAVSVLIAVAAMVVCTEHYLPVKQPYSGAIVSLSFGYIVVKLLVVVDPEFKTNLDITNKVIDSLRPSKPK